MSQANVFPGCQALNYCKAGEVCWVKVPGRKESVKAVAGNEINSTRVTLVGDRVFAETVQQTKLRQTGRFLKVRPETPEVVDRGVLVITDSEWLRADETSYPPISERQPSIELFSDLIKFLTIRQSKILYTVDPFNDPRFVEANFGVLGNIFFESDDISGNRMKVVQVVLESLNIKLVRTSIAEGTKKGVFYLPQIFDLEILTPAEKRSLKNGAKANNILTLMDFNLPDLPISQAFSIFEIRNVISTSRAISGGKWNPERSKILTRSLAQVDRVEGYRTMENLPSKTTVICTEPETELPTVVFFKRN